MKHIYEFAAWMKVLRDEPQTTEDLIFAYCYCTAYEQQEDFTTGDWADVLSTWTKPTLETVEQWLEEELETTYESLMGRGCGKPTEHDVWETFINEVVGHRMFN